ncbi:MAG: 2-dehydropantoate 2-reductase [Eubacteriales bacterium]|nr:2-dehydropantoate 2-reductase [Eubacteriales bacterium]
MRVYIAGSGAMGSCFGYKLMKTGDPVVFLDHWAEQIDSLNNGGLRFGREDSADVHHVHANRPEEARGEVDLIILFCKSMQLEETLAGITGILGARTQVLCLLNGLGHVDTLKKYVAERNIFIGVTTLSASLPEAGRVCCHSLGKTEIQSISGDMIRCGNIVAELNYAGIPTHASDDVFKAIWKKACINGTTNAFCTLFDCNIHGLSKVPGIEALVEAVVREFAALAQAQGTKLWPKKISNEILDLYQKSSAVGEHYPSMHQDLRQKRRPTEIDFLNGYVARKSAELGLEAPHCQMITEAIHGLEALYL